MSLNINSLDENTHTYAYQLSEQKQFQETRHSLTTYIVAMNEVTEQYTICLVCVLGCIDMSQCFGFNTDADTFVLLLIL